MSTLSSDEINRYNRHIIIPEIGMEGQEKLKKARVLVIGCGGLGNASLPYLTAAGVGKIGLVDFDTVDESNLQRQVFFDTNSVGEFKTNVLKKKLENINPFIEIVSHNVRVDSKNISELFKEYDIIADGTDNFDTRYLINDACVLLNKVNVFASIYRFDAQISVFNYRNGPCYRCIFPEPPLPESVPSCAEAGVFGVLPGIAGTLQANEIVKIITGVGKVLSGKLFIINTLTFQTQLLELDKDITCPICGINPTITKLEDDMNLCCLFPNVNKVPEVTISEFIEIQRIKEPYQLIDVREPAEYAEINMNGELIPLNTIHQNIEKISRLIKVIVHCRSGKRSAFAVSELQKKYGFTNIYSLKGGILEWNRIAKKS